MVVGNSGGTFLAAAHAHGTTKRRNLQLVRLTCVRNACAAQNNGQTQN